VSEQRETVFEHEDHELPPAASVSTIFAVLVVLALAALAVGFSDLGPWKVLLNMLIAVVQASVLAYFFMDLRQADTLTWLCAGAAMFWVGLMFLFTLTDYLTRYLAAI
jgi:cytochrome c oxidase subunit 4